MKHLLKALVPCILYVTVASAQQRITLVEQFTNSGCPTCAASVPAVYNYANANTEDLVIIAYHTSFPYNDSMYHENETESDARVAFYGIGGVPYSIVDGNVYENATSQFVQVMSTTINGRNAISPDYDIQSLGLTLSGSQLNGQFNFTSLSASNAQDSLVAHIVVIEKNVAKSSYAASPGANSETEYGYVMRKMFPGANGTTLQHTGLNSSDTVNLNLQISHIKDISELRIAVFVQNTATKEVYQAQLFNPNVIMGIHEEENVLYQSNIYPNPINGSYNLSFNGKQFIKSVNIYDAYSKQVDSKIVNESTEFVKQQIELSNGVYTLEVKGNNSSIYKKILVINNR